MSCSNCGKEFKEGEKIRQVTEGIFRERCGPVESPESDAVEITKAIKVCHVNCQYPGRCSND